MANYIVHWILAALALLACISEEVTGGEYSVHGREYDEWMQRQTEEDNVRSELLAEVGGSSGPEQVFLILLNYAFQYRRTLIKGHTVGELVSLCRPYKCSFDKFKRIYEIGLEYQRNIPKLSGYVNYCINERLNHCIEHIDTLDDGDFKQVIMKERDLRGEGSNEGGAEEVDSPIWKLIKKVSGLASRLTIVDSAPEYVEEMFKKHRNKQDEVYGRTVAQWTEICEESESRCSHSVAQTALRLMDTHEHIPQLAAYIGYCVDDKVRKYCIKNIDEVGTFLLKETMSKEQQELVRPLVQHMKDKDVLGKYEDAHIVEAYSKLLGASKIPADQEQAFREKVNEALKSFKPIDHSFFGYLRIEKMIKPKGDIIVTEWLMVSWIADEFAKAVSAATKAQPELFKSVLAVSSPPEDEA